MRGEVALNGSPRWASQGRHREKSRQVLRRPHDGLVRVQRFVQRTPSRKDDALAPHFEGVPALQPRRCGLPSAPEHAFHALLHPEKGAHPLGVIASLDSSDAGGCPH